MEMKEMDDLLQFCANQKVVLKVLTWMSMVWSMEVVLTRI